MVNLKKMVEIEIDFRDKEREKFYKLYADHKITNTEYLFLRDKIYIEINLLRELQDKYD